MKAFPVKIGLEVHGYLDTREKLFCMCRTAEPSGVGSSGCGCVGGEVNSRICPICTGTPGSKPMAANGAAVEKLIEIACVFGSRVNLDVVWQRKHYSWADLPKGYQTTVSGAHVLPNAVGGRFAGINITELHLEEDPAQWNPDTGRINYNRSGLPLVEIVTEPEFSDAEQVVEWLKKLLLSLSYIKAVRKNAGIKVDVNVSTYGERVEMKNLNSLEKIRKAIEYEVQRQVELYSRSSELGVRGSEVLLERETRMFDEGLGKTVKMRSKESAQDYRFISDPDLARVVVSKGRVNELKKGLPEMPSVKLDKLLKRYKVGEKDAKILTRNLELVEFFEKLVEFGVGKGKNETTDDTDSHGHSGGGIGKYMSWVTIELLRVLNYNRKSLEDEDVEILPEHLAELIKAVERGEITVLKGKQIMNDFVPKSFSIKEGKDIGMINEEAVENLCRQVVSENLKTVEEYKSGKSASLNYLIGQVMRLSERRADFKSVTEVMKRLIGKEE